MYMLSQARTHFFGAESQKGQSGRVFQTWEYFFDSVHATFGCHQEPQSLLIFAAPRSACQETQHTETHKTHTHNKHTQMPHMCARTDAQTPQCKERTNIPPGVPACPPVPVHSAPLQGHVTPPLVGSTHTGLGRATRRGPSFAAFVSLMEALLRLYVPGLRVGQAPGSSPPLSARHRWGYVFMGPIRC